MPFTIDEAFLPAILTAHPMTDQQFEITGQLGRWAAWDPLSA